MPSPAPEARCGPQLATASSRDPEQQEEFSSEPPGGVSLEAGLALFQFRFVPPEREAQLAGSLLVAVDSEQGLQPQRSKL